MGKNLCTFRIRLAYTWFALSDRLEVGTRMDCPTVTGDQLSPWRSKSEYEPVAKPLSALVRRLTQAGGSRVDADVAHNAALVVRVHAVALATCPET